MFRHLFKKFISIKQKTVPLSIQLEKLGQIGISINSTIDSSEIFNIFEEKEFEQDPYCSILIALGCEVQTSDDFGKPISKSLWYLDTECIEDTGDYVRIVGRVADLTQDSLLLSNIHDYVDIDNKKVWVAFSIGDKKYKWELKAKDDWLDINIFSRFNKLLSNKKSTKQFAISVLDQSILIAFLENDQVQKLNDMCNFEFKIV